MVGLYLQDVQNKNSHAGEGVAGVLLHEPDAKRVVSFGCAPFFHAKEIDQELVIDASFCIGWNIKILTFYLCN